MKLKRRKSHPYEMHPFPEAVEIRLESSPSTVCRLSLESSLSKPRSPSHAALLKEFWLDVVAFARWVGTAEQHRALPGRIIDVAMCELCFSCDDREQVTVTLPKVEVTILLYDTPLLAQQPLTVEVLYLGDGVPPGPSREEGDDAITVRARVMSAVTSAMLTESGLLSEAALSFCGGAADTEDIIGALCLVASLIFASDLPTACEDAIRRQLVGDEALMAAWEQHAGGACSRCVFAAAMPCSFEELQQIPDTQGRAEQLARLKERLIEEVRQEETKRLVAAMERQTAVAAAISSYQPHYFGRISGGEVAGGASIPLFGSAGPFSSFWRWADILDPALLPIVPPLLEELRAGSITETLYRERLCGALLPFRRVEIDNVFSYPCLSHDFCNALVAELKNYEATPGMPRFRPNSMNEYGVIVNEIGLQPFMSALCRVLLFPLGCRDLPQHSGRGTLDHAHSFVVEYGEGRDVALDMHVDDSEVTFSVNLCDTFEGSSLVLCGLLGQPNRRRLSLEYHHALGRVLLHAGAHRHGAKPITYGERFNLIIWGRSSMQREFFPKPSHVVVSGGEAEPPDPVCMSKTWDPDYSDVMGHA